MTIKCEKINTYGNTKLTSCNKGEKKDNDATKLSNNSAKRQETMFPSRVRNLVISVNGHLWFTGC